jgi:Uma2 family endonuclease
MSAVTERLVIGPGMAGALMTPEEFDAAEDWEEGYIYELIQGVLVVSPPAGIEERGPNDWLGQLLRNYRDAHPKGRALDYTVTEHTIKAGRNRRRADRVVWAGLGRRPDFADDVPTIAFEYVSPRRRAWRRDYEAKRAEYEAAGVSEYVIIDRFRRTVSVFRREGKRKKYSLKVLTEKDVYTTSFLPGFKLSLARLFQEIDFVEGGNQGSDEIDV